MSNINVIEDFLRYVKIDTQSDDTTGASPSTAKQHDLASLLEKELIEIVMKYPGMNVKALAKKALFEGSHLPVIPPK